MHEYSYNTVLVELGKFFALNCYLKENCNLYFHRTNRWTIPLFIDTTMQKYNHTFKNTLFYKGTTSKEGRPVIGVRPWL